MWVICENFYKFHYGIMFHFCMVKWLYLIKLDSIKAVSIIHDKGRLLMVSDDLILFLNHHSANKALV